MAAAAAPGRGHRAPTATPAEATADLSAAHCSVHRRSLLIVVVVVFVIVVVVVVFVVVFVVFVVASAVHLFVPVLRRTSHEPAIDDALFIHASVGSTGIVCIVIVGFTSGFVLTIAVVTDVCAGSCVAACSSVSERVGEEAEAIRRPRVPPRRTAEHE